MALRKPARVAVDRKVVDGDDRRAPDIAQRKNTGRTEERIGLELPDPCGPLQVAADQPCPRQRPVAAVGHVDEGSRWTEDRKPAVGPVDGHRVEDLRRVDADSGARALEPDPVDYKMQSNQGAT